MKTTLILGAGVMGTAFSFPLADSGGRVLLVGTHLDTKYIKAMKAGRPHPKLGVVLPANVEPRHHGDLPTVLAHAPGLIVLGVSSPGVGWAVEQLIGHLPRSTPVLLLTKGLEVAERRIGVLPEFVAQHLHSERGWPLGRILVGGVGGPCIAGELAVRRETRVIMGVPDAMRASLVDRFSAPYYHVRYTHDVVGVELNAALKNFFAIGVGTAAGRSSLDSPAANGAQAHNPAAALFGQASAELRYLTGILGGEEETSAGLAGVGDLYVTCQAGRNSRMGRLLGTGLSYAKARSEMAGETVEGADLALTIGPAIGAMINSGELDRDRIPLTRAILSAICEDRRFDYAP